MFLKEKLEKADLVSTLDLLFWTYKKVYFSLKKGDSQDIEWLIFNFFEPRNLTWSFNINRTIYADSFVLFFDSSKNNQKNPTEK